MSTAEILHARFNPHYDQIPPVRIKSFTREHFAMLLGELGFTKGAEIGVAEGIYSKALCTHIPHIKLFAIDIWDTYERGDEWHKVRMKDREEQDRCLALAHEKLDPYGVTFIRKASIEAATSIADGSLDFVYIDGNHSFDYVMQDIIIWSQKVRKGGIISGHDAYRFRGAGVAEALQAYTTAHQIHEWFVDDMRETSWFWAK